MTSVLRRMQWSSMDAAQRRGLVSRSIRDVVPETLRADIGALVDDVAHRGDDAVIDATRRFDGVSLQPSQLRVGSDELHSARVDDALHAALRLAIDHVHRYNTMLRERLTDWSHEVSPGVVAGERVTPIASAGLFVPSGKASYPSVAYHLGVPAVVAGVPRIAVLVPPAPGGSGQIDPAVLVVCRELGIDEVYRANGPAGIAALGLGTASIAPVRKIVGPGSPAVTAAQVEMQRHGVVTMMVLGPTESMLVADATTEPIRAALDLLVEAEHGEDSTVVLVTRDAAVVDAIDRELSTRLATLPAPRARAARSSLGVRGGAVLVESVDEACEVVNAFAPEHLQIAIDGPAGDAIAGRIVHAGEILLGQHTPFSAANFVLGCPASLPTTGFAAVSSGITAAAFLKTTAVARADEAALRRLGPAITAIADHEGFPAHADAVRARPD
jgi:histidinol dehydrogenase